MRQILQDLNVNLTERQQSELEEFKNLLLFYNKSFNLTSITDTREFIIKHIADSLAGAHIFKENTRVCEVGSGGGFPSIPIKIVRQDLNFTLIESIGKKCKFLQEAIAHLGLKNIRIINDRAENIAKDTAHREKYGGVCARAVAKLNTLAEYCAPFLKIGGLFAAYKTYNERELSGSKNAQKVLGIKLKEIYNYELPEGYGQRSILIFEKTTNTPQIYPRGRGRERSAPL